MIGEAGSAVPRTSDRVATTAEES